MSSLEQPTAENQEKSVEEIIDKVAEKDPGVLGEAGSVEEIIDKVALKEAARGKGPIGEIIEKVETKEELAAAIAKKEKEEADKRAALEKTG